MKIFRIKIYLKIKIFLKSIFYKDFDYKVLDKIILRQTNNTFLTYTSQLRTGFLLILLYLKSKFKGRNEVVLMSYNLKEMINIPSKLNLKIVFCDVDIKTGSMSLDDLKQRINKKTLCVVLTNIFSNYKSCKEIKNICRKKKIPLIEDNAIYFDNYIKKEKKYFSGSFGDFSLLSFNVMKNISGLYGGCLSHNNKEFFNFCKKEFEKKITFPNILLFRQMIIFLVLKIFSINLLYKYFFNYLFYFSTKYNLNVVQNLIYPSLRFKNVNIPRYYMSPISDFSKKLIYFQFKDKKQRLLNHEIRKKNNKLYYQKFKKINLKYFYIFKIDDFNFQNFLEFPILFTRKDKLHKYLLKKGFDLKKIHYFNCSSVIGSKFQCANSQRIEDEILCLPNHEKINELYIDNIIKEIKTFYKNT